MTSRRLGTTLLPHFDDEVEESSSRVVLACNVDDATYYHLLQYQKPGKRKAEQQFCVIFYILHWHNWLEHVWGGC